MSTLFSCSFSNSASNILIQLLLAPYLRKPSFHVYFRTLIRIIIQLQSLHFLYNTIFIYLIMLYFLALMAYSVFSILFIYQYCFVTEKRICPVLRYSILADFIHSLQSLYQIYTYSLFSNYYLAFNIIHTCS